MSFRLLSESSTATLPGGVADLHLWEVRDDVGELVGAVRDAVLDAAGEVLYLDVRLAGTVRVRRVLLPVGLARLKPPARVVELPGVRRADIDTLLHALPDYSGDVSTITREYERRLGSAWSRDLTDQNSFGAVRSSDPDVGVAPPPGAEPPPP